MINWFRKKEIDTSFVDNCVPVTIKEEVYRKKIRTLWNLTLVTMKKITENFLERLAVSTAFIH